MVVAVVVVEVAVVIIGEKDVEKQGQSDDATGVVFSNLFDQYKKSSCFGHHCEAVQEERIYFSFCGIV